MNRKFNAAVTTVKGDVAKSADTICGPRRDNTVAGGTIGHDPKNARDLNFTLQVYTCFGVLLDTRTAKGPTIKAAVDAAVGAYALAHPDNS